VIKIFNNILSSFMRSTHWLVISWIWNYVLSNHNIQILLQFHQSLHQFLVILTLLNQVLNINITYIPTHQTILQMVHLEVLLFWLISIQNISQHAFFIHCQHISQFTNFERELFFLCFNWFYSLLFVFFSCFHLSKRISKTNERMKNREINM